MVFQAVAGTEYQIAVDGYDRGYGTVVLILIIEQPALCLPLTRQGAAMRRWPDGALLHGGSPIGPDELDARCELRNTDGFLRFTDPGTTGATQRFYRAIIEF